MAILPILEAPDPRLRTISTPVEAIDDDLQRLIDDMFETMYDAPGIGLAAIQVGVPKRVLVMDLQEPESDAEDAPPVKRPMVFINPEILRESQDLSVYNEGCLSVPEQYAEVERPATIRASWMDRDAYEWTYCSHTGKEKPPRAHYDHITERLVLNMEVYVNYHKEEVENI